jgi:transposase
MERYIGLDVHSTSCTAAIIGPSGKRIKSVVLETNGKVLLDFLKTVPGNVHLLIEEGTQAAWLYEILSPHVHKMMVMGASKKTLGQKNDRLDAFELAEKMRINAVDSSVFKNQGEFAALAAKSKAYSHMVGDSVRVQNRIKAIYRSRGVHVSKEDVYCVSKRDLWMKKLQPAWRLPLERYYQELDMLHELRSATLTEMLKEARRHKIFKILKSVPGLGEIRVAQILPIVVTPYRFRNKRLFWSYSGLGVVMRSSSDWTRGKDGSWQRANVHAAQGLNLNHNRFLKHIFKGAATTVIMQKKEQEPIYIHYQQALKNGTKPNLAKLTIARQIASITLSVWRSGKEYDPRILQITQTVS